MPIANPNKSASGIMNSWQKLSTRIDALTLRERAIIFLLAAVVLLVMVNSVLLDPLFSKQKRLSDTLRVGQMQIENMQTEIRQAVQRSDDPNAVERDRLKELDARKARAQAALADVQNSLVAPEKMTVLLEDILSRHGALQLVSLKTLPIQKSAEPSAVQVGAVTAADGTPPASTETDGTVYSHGVEIVVQGGYLEMLEYMSELERMPWRVFWGDAALKVDEYPQATLTLTLYTMSLNKKWLNL